MNYQDIECANLAAQPISDPNHVNDDDHHALWFACVHGDPDLVFLLIARGANIDNQNVNGATCAIYAASTGKLAAWFAEAVHEQNGDTELVRPLGMLTMTTFALTILR